MLFLTAFALLQNYDKNVIITITNFNTNAVSVFYQYQFYHKKTELALFIFAIETYLFLLKSTTV